MGLFRRKSEVDKLYDRYEKLKKEAFQLSTSNRSASDEKHKEAEDVLNRINEIKEK